jgi:hypothetical protein
MTGSAVNARKIARRHLVYRAEIIANRSVAEEVTEGLEAALPKILYTVITDVQGRGKDNRKLGTVTWPEMNFLLVAYVDDCDASAIKGVIATLKERFPHEGIKLFMVRSEE